MSARRAVAAGAGAAVAVLGWRAGRRIVRRPDVADYLLVLGKAVRGQPIMSKVDIELDAGAGIVVRAEHALIIRNTISMPRPGTGFAVERRDPRGLTTDGHGEHGEGDVSFDPERLADAAVDRPRCVNQCGREGVVQVTTGAYGAEHAATLDRALYAERGDGDDLVTDVEWMCAVCAAAAHPDGDGSSGNERTE